MNSAPTAGFRLTAATAVAEARASTRSITPPLAELGTYGDNADQARVRLALGETPQPIWAIAMAAGLTPARTREVLKQLRWRGRAGPDVHDRWRREGA